MEHKINHLGMIQGVINRMASNSFALKGWAVTLVVGIFVLAGKDADKRYFMVAYIPILVFWWLDSYYLLQERLYRAFYDRVRGLSEEQIDFAMQASARDFNQPTCTFRNCLMSKTELGFYLMLALVSTVVMVLAQVF